MAKKNNNIKYAIVQDSNLASFVSKINSLLEEGYELQGGVSSTLSVKQQNDIIYTQSLIYKYLNNENSTANKGTN